MIDYEKTGLKAGIEIHQRLNTNKLFCNCPSDMSEKKPDMIIGKPNPFLLNLALKEMGCFSPSNAVCVGDRLSTDILAGINAGMDTILVRTGISDNRLKKTIYPTNF